MAEQVRKDVAVFIDFENIYVSVRDKLDTNPNFEIIMDRCNELGRVILARAYADWYRYPRITSALYANNIEPMYVPTYYYDKDAGRTGRPIKNSVDMNLCIEAMRTLFTMPGLSTFVLITGDRDFIPLVNSIRQQGKDVIIIGVGGAASSHLAQSADEFIFYEHLIGKQIANAPTAQTNRRYSEIDEFERPARDQVKPVVQRAARHDSTKAEKTDRKEKEVPTLTEDAIWEMLAKAVVEARARSIVPSVGSLKTLVRELSNGEFRESMVRDASGRPLERFRDVVHEAAKQGKLIISTDSIVNEIFLPGEDPRTLSSFNVPIEKPPERAEEPLPSQRDALNEARATTPQRANEKSRRRRRNDRDSQREAQPATPVATLPAIDVDQPSESVQQPDDYAIVPPVAATSEPSVVIPPTADLPTLVVSVPFSDEERQMVRDIVASSERALSFQQIYDALRSTRNRGGDQQTPRTNEELRSLVKSVINAGELQRIGRGNRVSYRIAQPKATKPVAPVAESADEPRNDAEVPEAAGSDSAQLIIAPVPEAPVMVPTPDELDDGLSLPTPVTQKAGTKNSPPSDAPVATTPKKKTTNRGRRQSATAAPSKALAATMSTSDASHQSDGLTAPIVPAVTAHADAPKSAAKSSDTPKPKSVAKSPTKAKSSQSGTKSKSTKSTPKKTATTKSDSTAPSGSADDAVVSPTKPRRRKQVPEA